MSNKHLGKCPFCCQEVAPYVTQENNLRRDICTCPECSGNILVCRFPGCTNYAKSGEVYDEELCPECSKSAASNTGEILKWALIAAASAFATAAVSKDKDD